ncbi:hypothetical protein PS655_05786 [Pseudomonas fluorescens]|uniref:Uncharacterized protein n=1 Tax=Pseudomonas fluorescens TaxID=294 RepID=A0A5E6XVL1_PSEFL|nr:hypothetical protein PS655_05786 [Pseudomonas fluorescens]
MSTPLPPRGRGTANNPHNRFAPNRSVAENDVWYQEVPETEGTEVMIETAKIIITRNTSPDLPFDRSINPYRGCEHGCMCSVKGSTLKVSWSLCLAAKPVDRAQCGHMTA